MRSSRYQGDRILYLQRGILVALTLLLSVLASSSHGQSTSPTGHPARETSGPVSLVWLQSQPAKLDSAGVAELLKRIFDEETARSIVIPPAKNGVHAFLFTRGEIIFGIIVSDQPYFVGADREKAIETFRGPVRKLIEAHQSWVSIDVFEPEDAPKELVDPVLGKVAAALLDERALLLYAPHRDLATIPDKTTRARLAGLRPMEVLAPNRPVPVVKIDINDPEIKAAQDESRKQWPDFVSAWEKRDDSQRFFVKTAFVEGDQTEHMWILVHALTREKAEGTLDNDPESVQGVRAGDQLSVPVSAVEDWLYRDAEGKTVGGFTTKVLEKRDKQGPPKPP